jgi:hypothetical protein
MEVKMARETQHVKVHSALPDLRGHSNEGGSERVSLQYEGGFCKFGMEERYTMKMLTDIVSNSYSRPAIHPPTPVLSIPGGSIEFLEHTAREERFDFSRDY